MYIDPRACVLPNILDNATGFPNHTAGFHVVAENAVRGGHHHGRIRRRPVTTTSTVTVPRGGIVVVIVTVTGFCSGKGFIVIVLVVIVVTPFGSGSVHKIRVFAKDENFKPVQVGIARVRRD